MVITIDMVMTEDPCSSYTIEVVQKLWAGRESLTPSEVAGLAIPFEDRAWLLGRLLSYCDPTRLVSRCVVRDVFLTDKERDVPVEYMAWLESGNESLRPVSFEIIEFINDAWDVAWDAAWNAAWNASKDANWLTVWNAVRYVAENSRNDAWDVTWKKYIRWMAEFLTEN